MEAERRQVTVLFTDMVGFTSFSERAGEEAELAFTVLVGRHAGMVLRTCLGIVRDEADARGKLEQTISALLKKEAPGR